MAFSIAGVGVVKVSLRNSFADLELLELDMLDDREGNLSVHSNFAKFVAVLGGFLVNSYTIPIDELKFEENSLSADSAD
jgi:hypothetical protein